MLRFFLIMFFLLSRLTLSAYAQSQLSPCQDGKTARYDNCYGTFVFSSGEKYIGEWKDDKKNGLGTYTWPDGEKYVGEFKDDKLSGQGSYTHPSGEKYVGEYKDNKRNGHGTYTSSNGEEYDGEWKDGKREGQGKFKYLNGDIYIGEYKDDHIDGHGTFIYNNGDKFIGEWKNYKEVSGVQCSSNRPIKISSKDSIKIPSKDGDGSLIEIKKKRITVKRIIGSEISTERAKEICEAGEFADRTTKLVTPEIPVSKPSTSKNLFVAIKAEIIEQLVHLKHQLIMLIIWIFPDEVEKH